MFEFDLNVTGDGGDTIGEEFFSDVTGGKMTVFSSAKKIIFYFKNVNSKIKVTYLVLVCELYYILFGCLGLSSQSSDSSPGGNMAGENFGLGKIGPADVFSSAKNEINYFYA